MVGKFKSRLKKAIFVLLVFLAFFILFTKRFKQPIGEFPPSPDSRREFGVVVVVYDGDTIKVRFKDGLEKKVRLIGVDAPEMEEEGEEVKFRALVSKRFAFYYLYEKKVRLSYDWQLEDKYERLLAYIWSGQRLFNDFIIREGFAFVFLKFPFRKDYQIRFRESEEFARKSRKGFWKKEPFPRIQFQEAREHLGELISVEFKCSNLETKRRFLFLNSADKEFSALIPQENLSHFPQPKYYIDKKLLVTGFLEEFNHQPQIVIYFPSQIKTVNGD